MGQPSDGMPIGHVRRGERPFKGMPAERATQVDVLSDVEFIIVIDKRMGDNRAVQRYCRITQIAQMSAVVRKSKRHTSEETDEDCVEPARGCTASGTDNVLVFFLLPMSFQARYWLGMYKNLFTSAIREKNSSTYH